jgi:hypothetical protein
MNGRPGGAMAAGRRCWEPMVLRTALGSWPGTTWWQASLPQGRVRFRAGEPWATR